MIQANEAQLSTLSGDLFTLMDIPAMEDVCRSIDALRMPYMSAELRRIENLPSFASASPLKVLQHLFSTEAERRHQNRFAAGLRLAGFKYPEAYFDDTLYEPDRRLDQDILSEILSLTWVTEPKNLLITGLTGAGKTYFANALGVQILLKDRKVRYIRASQYIQELQRHETAGTITDAVSADAKWDVLIIDDFGLMHLDRDMCRNLFEVIETRDQRKATVVVSQYPVGSWYEMFEDATYAEALLDRLVQHAIRLDMKGINMRERL